MPIYARLLCTSQDTIGTRRLCGADESHNLEKVYSVLLFDTSYLGRQRLLTSCSCFGLFGLTMASHPPSRRLCIRSLVLARRTELVMASLSFAG